MKKEKKLGSNYCVEGKLGSDYQVFQKMEGLRNWDCTVVSFSQVTCYITFYSLKLGQRW